MDKGKWIVEEYMQMQVQKQVNDVLDKIRGEIVAYDDLIGHNAQIQWCLKVIDKYRESEK